MKVGDTFYYRITTGGLLYAQVVILQETSRSWLVAPLKEAEIYGKSEWFIRECTKLPKNGKGWVLGTKRDADLALWALEERYLLGLILCDYIRAAVERQDPSYRRRKYNV